MYYVDYERDGASIPDLVICRQSIAQAFVYFYRIGLKGVNIKKQQKKMRQPIFLLYVFIRKIGGFSKTNKNDKIKT